MRSKFVGGRAADHAEDLVALVEQELGQVGPVLAGDARDQRRSSFAHAFVTFSRDHGPSIVKGISKGLPERDLRPPPSCRRELRGVAPDDLEVSRP